jgi:hypothetical protein
LGVTYNSTVTIEVFISDAAASERRNMIFGTHFTLEDGPNAELITQIKRRILEVEHHEVDEWFRWHGEPVVDPHPENDLHCTCEPRWSENPSCCILHGRASIYTSNDGLLKKI